MAGSGFGTICNDDTEQIPVFTSSCTLVFLRDRLGQFASEGCRESRGSLQTLGVGSETPDVAGKISHIRRRIRLQIKSLDLHISDGCK